MQKNSILTTNTLGASERDILISRGLYTATNELGDLFIDTDIISENLDEMLVDSETDPVVPRWLRPIYQKAVETRCTFILAQGGSSQDDISPSCPQPTLMQEAYGPIKTRLVEAYGYSLIGLLDTVAVSCDEQVADLTTQIDDLVGELNTIKQNLIGASLSIVETDDQCNQVRQICRANKNLWSIFQIASPYIDLESWHKSEQLKSNTEHHRPEVLMRIAIDTEDKSIQMQATINCANHGSDCPLEPSNELKNEVEIILSRQAVATLHTLRSADLEYKMDYAVRWDEL